MVHREILQNGNPELRRKEKTMHATSIVKNIVLVHGAFADGTRANLS